jgi:uridine phosphorylase
MDWFDSSDDVVIQPSVERVRFWNQKYGTDRIAIAPKVLFVNNGHGRLFDAVCRTLDNYVETTNDYRQQGYCNYQVSSELVTIYRAPEPAPYAAADLEFLISAGAQQIIFVNGAGSLRADLSVGSVVLPKSLLREEGTSYHYVSPGVQLHTSERLNKRILNTANELGHELICGGHWTTDAIYRETITKIKRYREQGINTVDMELSALVGVAYYRKCELSAILVVTDLMTKQDTWDGMKSVQFQEGIRRATEIAAKVFL